MALSLILPVLNEAATIEATLRRLAQQAPDAERVVVDGGSTDGTADRARTLATVITAPKGRARQIPFVGKQRLPVDRGHHGDARDRRRRLLGRWQFRFAGQIGQRDSHGLRLGPRSFARRLPRGRSGVRLGRPGR